ncbi:uncharacterized protein K444DRAFT_413399 [Hyaloscypha bicolor E]|uniref:Uncharacterized protein n=1 Tax=Hyaloscypha bicolor E TaxID=1095630 RepID=A0A2J6T6K6_9HELO|nr:uncharacterized protein K444DRAFT_413399 [Hyaloscypha bicolor E]PMD58583.1 hypothetical protein K444DRAFT_413399 [Hyaloscypha bicolor E]
MRKMKQDHDQTITKLIGEHELHNDRHVGEVARIKRDHGKDLARLNGNIGSLDKRYEGDIKRLSIEHNSEIARLEEEHGEAETQARRYYDEEKARLEKTINGLRVELDRHKEESRNTATKLQASHASELQLQAKDHQIKEEEMESELGETKRKHEQAMRSLEYEHGLLLQKEIGIHSSMIETMKQDHEKERSKWARDLAKEKENRTTERLQLTTEYNQQQSLMEQDYANETRLIREASDKKVAGLRDDLESQQAQFTRKVEEIKEGCKFQLGKLISKLDRIEARHVAELRELRGSFEHEIEAYCEALLTRDKFTPIPDPEITSRFVALTQEVHALSLLEWKADRKKWSTQVLHQLSDNERSLKQQILKDIIWRALQEYIFCSPFRILGEEGKVLEKQWNDACGQDPRFDNGFYIWPEPGMEAERWRYVNIKECHAALRMRVASELDHRAKLKKSFKFSLENLRESMWRKIGEVVEYKRESVQAMEQMTIKAVNMWLEFGEQRCRILAIENRPNGEVVDDRVNKKVDLLVRPQLKRYGKSNGQDLDIEEIIKGCEGESINLSEV